MEQAMRFEAQAQMMQDSNVPNNENKNFVVNTSNQVSVLWALFSFVIAYKLSLILSILGTSEWVFTFQFLSAIWAEVGSSF